MLLRKHWYISNNVYDEYNECIKQERYRLEADKSKQYIQHQIKNGLNEECNHHCATGFIIRNMKHNKINEINSTWYQHIQQCGIECQISFFFVKQLFHDFIHPFSEIPFNK